MSKEISLPRPLKDRLLLTGTAPLYQICCLEKLPTSQLIFPDSLLSFLLLSPFGGRGIVHFGYYLARQFGNYVTATVETTRRAYGFARDWIGNLIEKTTQDYLEKEAINPKKNEFDLEVRSNYYFYYFGQRNNANGCGFQSPLDAKIENTSKPIIKKL